MIKDIILTILSTLNILMFTFIGLNEKALKKLMNYAEPSQVSMGFDEIVIQTQRRLLQRQIPLSATPLISETFLVIPKINLISPINVADSDQDITNVLAAGTLSLGVFVPPPKTGQTIIFGHSSDYIWNNNPYATVFTLLSKLAPGDQVRVIQNQNNFLYTVQKTVISDADLSSVINKNATNNELVLTTCYPLGFSSQRLNVIAIPQPS